MWILEMVNNLRRKKYTPSKEAREVLRKLAEDNNMTLDELVLSGRLTVKPLPPPPPPKPIMGSDLHPCVRLDRTKADKGFGSQGACMVQGGRPCFFAPSAAKECGLFFPIRVGRR